MARRRSLVVDQRGWSPALQDYASPKQLEAWLIAHGVNTAGWTGSRQASSGGAASSTTDMSTATRTVEELFSELQNGECELNVQGSKGVLLQQRIVEVRLAQAAASESPRVITTGHAAAAAAAQVKGPQSARADGSGVLVPRMQTGGGSLVEVMQIMPNGRQRAHRAPLQVTLLGGERPLDGAERCLTTYVVSAIPMEAVSIDKSSVAESERTFNSSSYPGLLTRERRYTVRARVQASAVGTQPGFMTEEVSADGANVLYRHVWAWQPRVEASSEVGLSDTNFTLLAWLLEGCSRVVVRLIRGGRRESSLLLSCHTYDEKGQLEEPLVCRIDDAAALKHESQRLDEMCKLTGGAGITKVSRGPYYLNGCGAMLIDMVNACWVLPEFYDQQEGVLLTTLKSRLGATILQASLQEKEFTLDTAAANALSKGAATPRGVDPTPRVTKSKDKEGKDKEGKDKNAKPRRRDPNGADALAASAKDDVPTDLWCADVLKDLFSAGAPLSVLSLESAEREPLYSCSMGGRIERFIRDLGILISTVFLPPPPTNPYGISDYPGYDPPAPIKSVVAMLSKRLDGVIVRDHVKLFKHSFVHVPRAAELYKVPVDSKSGQSLADLCSLLIDLLKPISRPAGFVNHKPLVALQHGSLTLENILIDLRSTVWLVDVAASAKTMPTEPLCDAANMLATLLFRHFPLSFTLEDIKLINLDEPNLLIDVMEVPMPIAARLHEAAMNHTTKDEVYKSLHKSLQTCTPQAHSEVSAALKLLVHVARDEAEARSRVSEACAVFDAMLGWTGEPPELWQIATRQAKNHWSAVSKLIFHLCTTLIRVAYELLVKCTQKVAEKENGSPRREGDDEEAEPSEGAGPPTPAANADLHISNLVMPLLLWSLKALHNPELSRWHKAFAWHATLSLANTLQAAIPRAPSQPPRPRVEPRQMLRLTRGQLVQKLAASKAERLLGGEGELQLGIVGLDTDASQNFDAISQVVLPWKAPGVTQQGNLDFNQIIKEPFNALKEVPLLLSLPNQMDFRDTFASEIEGAAEKLKRKLDNFHTLLKETTDEALKLIDQASAKWVSARQAAKDKMEKTDAEIAMAEFRLAQATKDKERAENRQAGDRQDGIDKANKELKNAARNLEHISGARSQEIKQVSEANEIFVAELKRAVTFDPVQVEESLGRAAPMWSFAKHRQLNACGLRVYAKEQQLFVLCSGKWRDVVVHESYEGLAHHVLRDSMQKMYEADLSPWNHAPCQLEEADCRALSRRYLQTLRAKHASIFDALSGKRLDVFDQTVPIEVATANGAPPGTVDSLGDIKDVAGLYAFLQRSYEQRVRHSIADSKACILLTGPPAAGKTCLMSQLIMHSLGREQKAKPTRAEPDSARSKDAIKSSGVASADPSRTYTLFPVLIKVQELQRLLLIKDNSHIFAGAWNWIDAYLRCKHGATDETYLMMRQTLMARRAMILLDGIDEGGKMREQIERHVTEVLAPQGHVMLVTSRPAGLDESAFDTYFHRLQMKPLREDQQQTVIKQRVDKEHIGMLWTYVREKVPLDTETGQRITGNPLMLSMIISIFTIRLGAKGEGLPAMPETISELYATAATTMIERVNRRERGAAVAAAAGLEETRLVEATFFQAHASLRRVMEEDHLAAAALQLSVPEKLANASKVPIFSNKDRAREGHVVEVVGLGMSRRGVCIRDNGSQTPFKVRFFDDGKITDWLKQKNVMTSKLSEDEFEAEYGDEARKRAIADAVTFIPESMREAMSTVRSRVIQDRLPLVSLLQGDPLQMQSSHLSFQEFYAAQSVCKGSRLPGAPPWQWSAWWSNSLKLGIEMGDVFRQGLLEACGAGGKKSLDLRQKIGGDRPTAFKAIAQLILVATSIDLSENRIDMTEFAIFEPSIRDSPTLTELNIAKNRLGPKGGFVIAKAVRASTSIAKLSLDGPSLPIRLLKIEAYKADKEKERLEKEKAEKEKAENATKPEKPEKPAKPAKPEKSAKYDEVEKADEAPSRNDEEKHQKHGKNNRAEGGLVVDLSRKALGSASGIVLAMLLPDALHVTELDTRYSGMEGEGARLLAEAVIRSSSLTKFSRIPLKELRANEVPTLSLVDTGLGTTEGWVLSAIIGMSSSLTELDVRSNLIGAVGAEQLAKAILASASIRRLSEIPLAELRENQISELDLSNKSLGPTEGRVLATILMLCTSLEEINLLGNRFDDEATSMLLGVKEEAARATKLAEGFSKEEAERERERVKSVTDAINVKSAAKERRKGLRGDEASGEGSIPVDTHASASVPALEDGNFHAPQRKTVKLLIPDTDYGSDPEEEEEEGGGKRGGSLDDEEEEEGGPPKASDHWERGILRGEDRPKVAADSTEKVILRLKTLCGLKHGQPHITFKHLSASCARLLAADIVTSSSVTQLNLQENTLGFEGGRAISLGIRANTSLVEVNVEGFALPVLQLKGLEPVPNNKLDLSSKKLGQASAVLIASVIGAEATAFNALRVLNLRNNEIDDIGLSALSGAVADGAMGWLERLFLNKNHIGNVGLTAFAEAIKAKRMNMLKELGISLNRIGDPGLHALTTVIKAGMLPCLTAIEVFPNPASSEAQEGLANFVNKKKRMPKLSPRKLGSGDPSYLSHRSGTEGALSHRSGTSAG